jgi:malate dehydrogenase
MIGTASLFVSMEVTEVDKDLISSFPVRVRGGKWEIVQNIAINDLSRAKIDASVAELKEERALVSDLIA